MYAAPRARIALNDRRGIDDLQLVLIGRDLQVVTRDDRDQRELRAVRLPALGAAAGVIECRVSLEGDRNGVRRALAGERPTGEILCAGLDAVVDVRMKRNSHTHSPLVSKTQ